MKPINVLIAIQARSNSTRFPRKIYEPFGDDTVLGSVISQAQLAADHVQRFTTKAKVTCDVAVLHPAHDVEIVRTFKRPGVIMIGGSEDDVLSRYVTAQRMTAADYVVRLTSDCPLILDFVIKKHINVAAINRYAYGSNIEEGCRTIADGFDCEIISRDALKWLDENAKSESDREHVTTAIRRERPRNLPQFFVSMKILTNQMKMSVDTPKDLERMRAYHHEREHKMSVARLMFGKSVYEL